MLLDKRTEMSSARDTAEIRTQRRRPGRLRAFLEDAAQAAGLAEDGLPVEHLDLGGVCGKKIVVVSTEPEFARALMRHAVGVAGRLGAEVVALTVGSFDLGDAGRALGRNAKARTLFLARAARSAEEFQCEAREAGIVFRHVTRFGRAADVVGSECAGLRRVEFVLTRQEEPCRADLRLSMPLFAVAG